jgi:hypothetical protein
MGKRIPSNRSVEADGVDDDVDVDVDVEVEEGDVAVSLLHPTIARINAMPPIEATLVMGDRW